MKTLQKRLLEKEKEREREQEGGRRKVVTAAERLQGSCRGEGSVSVLVFGLSTDATIRG